MKFTEEQFLAGTRRLGPIGIEGWENMPISVQDSIIAQLRLRLLPIMMKLPEVVDWENYSAISDFFKWEIVNIYLKEVREIPGYSQMSMDMLLKDIDQSILENDTFVTIWFTRKTIELMPDLDDPILRMISDFAFTDLDEELENFLKSENNEKQQGDKDSNEDDDADQ